MKKRTQKEMDDIDDYAIRFLNYLDNLKPEEDFRVDYKETGEDDAMHINIIGKSYEVEIEIGERIKGHHWYYATVYPKGGGLGADTGGELAEITHDWMTFLTKLKYAIDTHNEGMIDNRVNVDLQALLEYLNSALAGFKFGLVKVHDKPGTFVKMLQFRSQVEPEPIYSVSLLISSDYSIISTERVYKTENDIFYADENEDEDKSYSFETPLLDIIETVRRIYSGIVKFMMKGRHLQIKQDVPPQDPKNTKLFQNLINKLQRGFAKKKDLEFFFKKFKTMEKKGQLTEEEFEFQHRMSDEMSQQFGVEIVATELRVDTPDKGFNTVTYIIRKVTADTTIEVTYERKYLTLSDDIIVRIGRYVRTILAFESFEDMYSNLSLKDVVSETKKKDIVVDYIVENVTRVMLRKFYFVQANVRKMPGFDWVASVRFGSADDELIIHKEFYDLDNALKNVEYSASLGVIGKMFQSVNINNLLNKIKDALQKREPSSLVNVPPQDPKNVKLFQNLINKLQRGFAKKKDLEFFFKKFKTVESKE